MGPSLDLSHFFPVESHFIFHVVSAYKEKKVNHKSDNEVDPITKYMNSGLKRGKISINVG